MQVWDDFGVRRKVFQMSKNLLHAVFVFLIGVIAMIAVSSALFSTISVQSYRLLIALLITAGIFLLFGLIVGLFWRGGSMAGGVLLAAPILLVTILSALFSGFGDKTLTSDLPILATVLVAGVVGCYLGQRLTSVRMTESQD